jgi:hypothetical protein
MSDSQKHPKQHRRSKFTRFDRSALSQHSLVEHALCAVDPKQSLKQGYIHKASYFLQDKNRNLKKANVRVACPFGLSPNDELFLWGLLHLVFTQDDPTPEFSATPHYCLRQLGIVDATSSQGKRYMIFREAIKRLAGVAYTNDRFYDPIRGEHRDIAFGFLKYSLPIDPASSRAWRIVWDQQFFEFCYAQRGSFQFDLDTYRQFDVATRRLFLFLTKLFWRRQTATIDICHLAVNVLGFSATLPLKKLKQKTAVCANKLLAANIITLPHGTQSIAETIHKRNKGRHDITFHRGPYFDRQRQRVSTATLTDSPAYDPLKTIGFDDFTIRRILQTYKPQLVQNWADITLAANERKMITKDPKAYFNYYIKRAAGSNTTPPDWWRELRKQEERQRFEEQNAAAPTIGSAFAQSDGFNRAFDVFLESEAKEVFDKIMSEWTSNFTKAGQSTPEAKRSAEQLARQHLHDQFASDHPEFDQAA